MFVREYENITERVRRLRNGMTPSERQVWSLLKGRQLRGYKFRRQHPIVVDVGENGHKTYYIVDFYCTELKLAIEIDGPVHDGRLDYDRRRDQMLRDKGISVVRIKNESVSATESFIDAISAAIVATTKPRPDQRVTPPLR
jgi:very-short-patch-repair endonuclease